MITAHAPIIIDVPSAMGAHRSAKISIPIAEQNNVLKPFYRAEAAQIPKVTAWTC